MYLDGSTNRVMEKTAVVVHIASLNHDSRGRIFLMVISTTAKPFAISNALHLEEDINPKSVVILKCSRYAVRVIKIVEGKCFKIRF